MTPQQTLFRPEAIEFQRQHRQWGAVALLQPFSTKILVWFIAAAVTVIVVFFSLAQYARKETVVGYLTPTAGTAKIFAPRPGTIQAIHVEEGQSVLEGQELLTVVIDELAADGADVNATKLDALTHQESWLAGQMAAEEHRTASERDRLTGLLQGLEAQVSQLQAQINIQGERVRLSDSFVWSAMRLSAEGYMSEADRKRRQEASLEQKQKLSALGQQLAERQNQFTETRYALEQLPTVMAEKVQYLRNQLSETEQRIAEVKGRRAYVIRAPTAGRVSTLQATIGQSADPRRLQLEIIPARSTLQAELFVPTRAAGFVRAGQKVRILYDAFPYQKFGTYTGHIVKVSQTILTGTDVAGPVALKEPAYRVTASLERPDVDAYGEKIPLQPDMLLKADIILDKRSLMNWLIDPLLSARM